MKSSVSLVFWLSLGSRDCPGGSEEGEWVRLLEADSDMELACRKLSRGRFGDQHPRKRREANRARLRRQRCQVLMGTSADPTEHSEDGVGFQSCPELGKEVQAFRLLHHQSQDGTHPKKICDRARQFSSLRSPLERANSWGWSANSAPAAGEPVLHPEGRTLWMTHHSFCHMYFSALGQWQRALITVLKLWPDLGFVGSHWFSSLDQCFQG